MADPIYAQYSGAGGGGGNVHWKGPVDTAASLPASGNSLGDARVAQDMGFVYVWNGISWINNGGSGTVTSVALTAPNIFSITGSPITGAGTLALALVSQSQNLFLASPNGSSGVPSFRAIVAADVPTLNQNTTGTASNVTGIVALINGGTGLAAASANAAFNALSPLTTKGDILGFSTVNARLAVGTNGQILVADSTQTLGIKWATVGTGITSINSDTTAAQLIVGANNISVSTTSGTTTVDGSALAKNGANSDITSLTGITGVIKTATEIDLSDGTGSAKFKFDTGSIARNHALLFQSTNNGLTSNFGYDGAGDRWFFYDATGNNILQINNGSGLQLGTSLVNIANDTTNVLNIGTSSKLCKKVWTTDVNLDSSTASSLLGTDASKNLVTVALTGDVTTSALAATIAAGAVTNAKVSATAAIAFSKLAALTSAHILVGNGSNVATDVALSGDATLANTGALTIANNAVSNAKLAQMATLTLKGNNTGSTANALDLTVAQVKTMLNSSPTIQSFTSGSGTYTTPAGVLWIRVRMIGGGGGGGGGANAVSNDGGAGGDGGDTTFGSSLLTAGKGSGSPATSATGNAGGAGGTTTLNSPAIGKGFTGSYGGSGLLTGASASGDGGFGGVSFFAGTGKVGQQGIAPTNSATNSGSGGAGSGASAAQISGAGGGSGGYVEAIIQAPSATYAYAVGAAGTAGSAGTGGGSGAAGGSGYIIVEEFYQ